MTPLVAAAAAIAVAASAVFFLLLQRSAKAPTASWTAVTDGSDYGAKVEATGSFDFPVAPDSVHYVTKGCGDLGAAKGIAMRFRIDADPGVQFQLMQRANDRETPVAGSTGLCPVLYFQRAGDDWSGAGAFEAYRWWATAKPMLPLAPGDFALEALFSDRWTAVETSNSDDNVEAFRGALKGASRVGFTFPGETGMGHGCCATGKARFTLIDFSIF